MENLIESIRAALAPDAKPEARAAAVAACRAILAALEPAAAQPAPPPVDASQIAGMIGALRGMPADKLLDVAIGQLRAKLPAGAEVAPVRPLVFHLVPVPGQKKP